MRIIVSLSIVAIILLGLFLAMSSRDEDNAIARQRESIPPNSVIFESEGAPILTLSRTDGVRYFGAEPDEDAKKILAAIARYSPTMCDKPKVVKKK